MTLFPIGTFLRLIRLVRQGSRAALVCVVALVAGIGLLVLGVITDSTVWLVLGVVLCGVGVAGSRPGARLM